METLGIFSTLFADLACVGLILLVGLTAADKEWPDTLPRWLRKLDWPFGLTWGCAFLHVAFDIGLMIARWLT